MTNREMKEQFGPAMTEFSKVLAGQAEPTRSLFMDLARLMNRLLEEHEAALARLARMDRPAERAKRKAVKAARRSARKTRKVH